MTPPRCSIRLRCRSPPGEQGKPYLNGPCASSRSAAQGPREAWIRRPGFVRRLILDRVAPGPLPPGNYLLIATVPPNLPISAAGDARRPEFGTWTGPIPCCSSWTWLPSGLPALALRGRGPSPRGGDVPLLWAFEGAARGRCCSLRPPGLRSPPATWRFPSSSPTASRGWAARPWRSGQGRPAYSRPAPRRRLS